MFKKLVLLMSFALVLTLAGTDVAFGQEVWEGRISSGSDDYEQYVSNGDMDSGSSDLEITEEGSPGSNQLVGLRFNGVVVPQGANITNAYVQFHVDETDVPGDNRPGTKFLRGEAVDNAAPFLDVDNNMSSRPTTSAEASWDWPEWLIEHEEGPDQRTSDISAVIQEITDRPGWSSGNSLVLIINGTGENTAEAFEGESDAAALLHIEYATISAYSPSPANGSMYEDTWASLSWGAGITAVSHDVYMSDNFDDVNDGTAAAFQGNQSLTFLTVGFPGFLYPDGLVPGTTYYWRIDEVEADGTTIHKGPVWSFTVPPKTAYGPDPVEGAEFVDLNVQLKWTAGFGAKLHYIIFGEDFDEVSNAATGTPNGTTSYSPGLLELAKTYYWRVDEFDSVETHKGEVWSFTTEGAVSGPNPADGAVDIKPSVVLSWDAGAVAASHEVYFGMDADAVKNATNTSPEYKGPKALGEESYDPGMLSLNTTYFWRIDEVNGVNPDSPWAGNVWSFTTGDFFVIDDFEIYDANDNQIWFAWHDGLGAGAPGTPGYLPGNGTGSAVGDETTASYTEETIIHGGLQSMPIAYDNNKQGSSKYSEVELTLSAVRDWTAEGVTELSLWFRGNPASVGSFIEAPVGTYTMTAIGADIWNDADEFHYAFKTLTGPGTIIAKVESVEQTDNWAKCGVMIRETLSAGSKFAAVYITPTNPDGTSTNGCRFQIRLDTDTAATSDSGVATAEQTAIVAPYWVKLERDVAGNFRASYSSNGSTWRQMAWNPRNISMSSTVYVGLALTSHNNAATCQAVFSNVTITGTVGQQWANQDIGIASNSVEPLYVAVSNSAGAPAVVVHDNPDASVTDIWTEWVIPLQVLADQGIVLTNVDRIAIGLGTQGNMTIPGGSGKMYIDDVRLYQSSTAP